MSSPDLDPHSEAMLYRSLNTLENRDLSPYPHEGTEIEINSWVEDSLRRNTKSLERDKRIRSILQAMISLLEE